MSRNKKFTSTIYTTYVNQFVSILTTSCHNIWLLLQLPIFLYCISKYIFDLTWIIYNIIQMNVLFVDSYVFCIIIFSSFMLNQYHLINLITIILNDFVWIHFITNNVFVMTSDSNIYQNDITFQIVESNLWMYFNSIVFCII